MRESFVTVSMIFHNQYGDHAPQQGWSKWGGVRYGILREELDEWFCQVCGDKQVNVLPCYLFPDENGRDFARVCSVCKAEAVVKKISTWEKLLLDLRKEDLV